MTVKYIKGDLFEGIKQHKKVCIPHIVNDIGAWGAGFVVALSKHFPQPEREYHKWYEMCNLGTDGELPLGDYQDVYCDGSANVVVMNMVAQKGVGCYVGKRPPIRYWALCEAMLGVAYWMEDNPGYTICCCKFGSGLSGGNWDFIETLILEIWADFNVEIYYL